MKIRHPFLLLIGLFVLLHSLDTLAEPSDSTLITNAHNYAKQRIPEAKTSDLDGHCKHRAIYDYSLPPTAVGRYQLNEVKVHRESTYQVSFYHNGIAYDLCNCRVLVTLNRDGKPENLTAEKLGCAQMIR